MDKSANVKYGLVDILELAFIISAI